MQVLRRAKHDPTPDQPAAIQALRLALDPEVPGVKVELDPSAREQAEAEVNSLYQMPPERAQSLLDRANLDLPRLAEATSLPQFAQELLEQLLTTVQEGQPNPAPEEVY